MKILGLKYIGNREEGTSIMLFKSYKTIMVSKNHPYRFTGRDIVSIEAANYYSRLRNLGVSIITDESDFDVRIGRRFEVRQEKPAFEKDVQVDVTREPGKPEDQMSEVEPGTEEASSGELTADVSAEPDQLNPPQMNDPEQVPENPEGFTSSATEVVTKENPDFPVDKTAIREMGPSELGEYIEMNLNRDQIKSMITDLQLDIAIGRKSSPTLIGEIISSADPGALINYLCK